MASFFFSPQMKAIYFDTLFTRITNRWHTCLGFFFIITPISTSDLLRLAQFFSVNKGQRVHCCCFLCLFVLLLVSFRQAHLNIKCKQWTFFCLMEGIYLDFHSSKSQKGIHCVCVCVCVCLVNCAFANILQLQGTNQRKLSAKRQLVSVGVYVLLPMYS